MHEVKQHAAHVLHVDEVPGLQTVAVNRDRGPIEGALHEDGGAPARAAVAVRVAQSYSETSVFDKDFFG